MKNETLKEIAGILDAIADGAEWEWGFSNNWYPPIGDGCPLDYMQNRNAIRLKPRTININGYEVPEPVREPLEIGQSYYPVKASWSDAIQRFEWSGDSVDLSCLKKGLIHLTAEAAQLHAKALLSFTAK